MEAAPQIARPDPETSEARAPRDASKDLQAPGRVEPSEESTAPAEASASGPSAAVEAIGSAASDEAVASTGPDASRESGESSESVESVEAAGPHGTAAAPGGEAESPAAAATEGPTLPVAVGEPRKRRSLWRRLTGRGEPQPSEPNGFQDMVKSRLDGITLRLESFEHGIARNEARLESRFALLERIEQRLEELSDLAERADQARAAAREAAEASRGAAQTARAAAGVAAVAVVISVAALLVGLGLIG